MVLAPEGQYIQSLLSGMVKNKEEVLDYIEQTSKKTDLDRQINQEKTGVKLDGVVAINPVNNEEIPIFIADYVIASYGTGAIMAVPAHDERDFEFAKKFDIFLKAVVFDRLSPVVNRKESNEYEIKYKLLENISKPYDNEFLVELGELAQINVENRVVANDGVVVNSDFLNGLTTEEAKEKMITWLEEKGLGNRKVQYKLRDWSVSRQRFWGAPIPMVRNQETGELKPVDFADLPIRLPEDVDFKPTGQSPLTYSKTFQEGVEERYGKDWKREVDTLDTFMCSSWYYYRYLDPKNENEFASPEALKKWMPVDFYLGGPEHVNGHLLYARFFTKVLFDEGLIDFDEPFKVHRHQGLILGPDNRKMSKRWGNVINPTDIVEKEGADTMRMYEMFMGPIEEDKPWDENGVKGVKRFLDKVWNLQEKLSDENGTEEIEKILHKTIKKVAEDLPKLSFNTSVAKLMELTNALQKEEKIDKKVYADFLKILSPFAPHIAEELWSSLGNINSIATEKWPEYDESKIKEDKIILAVQVNGKVRDELQVDAEISEEDVKKLVLVSEKIQQWLDGKEVKKIIYVKGRLVSVVV
jgi:leucyl-tRNA synthetase